MSDASDRVSCISHKKATRFFVIYDDFLTVAKVSEHQHKLAAFWRVLETKTNDWIAQHADKVDALLKADKPLPKIWVEMNYNDFVNRCLGFYKASSFRIAAVESERLGFSESRVRTRKTKPTDPDSPTEEYKEYSLNIQALQSVMNGGAYPTPVENNSPLLKKRKKKTPVENNSPSVENNKPPLLFSTETPVENNNLNNIEELPKNVEEENAHVSDDNAPTPSLSESNSPSSLFSQYDLLLAYRDNQLEHLYECEKAAMVNMSQKLSPNRAGELAAAKLSVQFCEQYVRFKDEVDNLARTPSQQVTPEQEALYDWLVDHWNVRSDLTTLSGTRTLILDEDMYRSSLQETSIEESTSAPSDEQTSEVSDSQSKDVPPAQDAGKTSSGNGKKTTEKPAKPAQSKLIEDEPKPPARPQMPAESMKWGTNKCKLMFDAWRGAPLMVEYKLMQASKVAKNLASYYSEDQVRAAKARMDEDEYYVNLGGADIMDVGNNIAKYLKRIETEAKKQRKNSGSGNDNTVSQTTQTAAALAEAEQSNKANLEKLRARKAAMQAKQKGA